MTGSDGRHALAARMAAAADEWLGRLRPHQRQTALWPAPRSGDARAGDRVRWFYTPTDHGGLPLGGQAPAQQALAMRLVATGLSEAGFNTVATVMGLENVLERVEDWSRDWGFERGRDPARYWLRVFGRPGRGPWGWRFGGHHVSLNYAVAGGAVVATTPCFLGADPAVSPLLGGAALRPLGGAEDLARRLVTSLDAAQLAEAVLHPRAPSDIVGGNRPYLEEGGAMLHMNDSALWRTPVADARLRQLLDDIDERAETGAGYAAADHARVALSAVPRGVPASRLRAGQRALLRGLLAAYQRRVPDEAWRGPYAEADLDFVHFAWAGPVAPGAGHYYRVQGPDVHIEYDNTQRDGNHAHSVWRDPGSDFGGDALREHRARAPHG
ncbi:DUF3500 domain-containing protein [Phytohabitans suffuscus]|uniref:DUF3500 domain-containing protein n=1 Tax=Phytohabitans suffuscus TaxID=624315 RepID=A0A6F8YYS8_9ACTN|nr:DUF3500 domain-containing protein [Phytohabitans suffuscus]BCB91325.1 hypothetical protein Psuf_086380 [Phytohabitans suffuscus]